ncbi:MAG: phenylacetate--CoA ligase [Actinomycetes bacterium]|jgi:phenylacetate-CoA ligase|nr:phenylacetate--CoA ligase [Actinomycetes bacterium]
MKKIWNEAAECMPRAQLEAMQLEQLKVLVPHLYNTVPQYKAKLDAAKIDPHGIKVLSDLKYLPYTVKQDLRDAFPYKMFAAPMADIIRLHASSGTTGSISVTGYTRYDIDTWSECVARSIVAAGGEKDDIIHVAYGYGIFTGGLGLHYGAEWMGACAIPVGGGNTKRQVQFLRDLVTKGGMGCTPSYALLIAEAARELGEDPTAWPLRYGIYGAEPWSENIRTELERQLGIDAYDIYGLSEIMGPGVGFECEVKNGLHIQEDHFLFEIVDQQTGEPVPDGEYGELVITTPDKQGQPLLRYNTRDVTRVIPEPCSCGRTHRRIERVTGRTDDMIIIRGVNVYPSQIEQILMSYSEQLAPQYQVIVTKHGSMDHMEVQVELNPTFDFDEIRSLEALRAEAREAIRTTLAVNVELNIVEPHSIERTQGKAVRLIDKR